MSISSQLFESLKHYIDKNLIGNDLFQRSCSTIAAEEPGIDIYNIVSELEETFSQALFRIIREKQLSEVDTYKAARMDRKLFSKIRSNDNYVPGRKTAIAFAIALQLNIDESLAFLKTAGITLSHSSKFDLIIEYFIKNEIYDIYQINEALYEFDQDLLTS